MIDRQAIVREARSWIGTRYRHQGRAKGIGVDCIGLIGGIAAALNLTGAQEWAMDRDLHNYARTPDPTLLLAACLRYFDRVASVAEAREGDILLFSLQNQPRHFAVISVAGSGPMRVVHAYALLAARRVVEQSLPIAGAKIMAAYSYQGLTA